MVAPVRAGGSRQVVLWVGAVSLVLLWPAVLNGGALLFFDSAGYYEGGRQIAAFLKSLLSLTDGVGAAAAAAEDEGGTRAIRSLAYSFLVYGGSSTPFGTWGAIWLQALLTATALVLLFRDRRTGEVAAMPIFVLAFGTGVAWYTSFLMPDIYAGLLIVVALLLVRDAERIGVAEGLALAVIAVIGNAAHYGHPPLGLALAAVVLAVLLWQRRWRWRVAALAVLPPAFALMSNLAASALVLEEPSVTPKRLPILLARSIEDGPARWHLDEHCDDYRYVICGFFDTIPEKASKVLFGKGGIAGRATPEEMERIRAEEQVILRRAVRDYPFHQLHRMLGNIAAQTVRIGTDDFRWGPGLRDADGRLPDMPEPGERRLLGAFGALHGAAAIAAVAAIALFAFRDGLGAGRHERTLLAVAVLGLLANAAIFGGLSAPADRYQGRVIWILPALALLFWTNRRRPRWSSP